VREVGADVKAGATELALTVRTASALVAAPPLLLTTTEERPASEACTSAMVRVSLALELP
jgi:hypothetical protein